MNLIPAEDDRVLKKVWMTGIFLVCLLGTISEAKEKKHIPLDVAVTHNNQGVQYLTRQETDKAEWEFKTAVEVDPNYADAWSNLGLVYKYRGRYEEAIDSFQKAIKADPKWASPYNHLGTAYLATEEYAKAIDYFKKALEKNKKLADASYNMGVAYLNRAKKEEGQSAQDPKPDWKRAVVAFQKATQTDPHLYNAHLELADTYRKLGEWEKAIIRYRVAIETNPNDPTPWQHLCALYQEKGDEAKASECLVKAQQKTPSPTGQSENIISQGENFIREQRYGEAMNLFREALKVDPDNAVAHFNIGYVHYVQGQYQQALSSYREAIRIQPNYLAAHYNLAVTYVALQDFARGIAALTGALRVNPEHPRSLYDLGRLYDQTGKKKEAAATLCHFKKVAPPEMREEKEIAEKLISQLGGC